MSHLFDSDNEKQGGVHWSGGDGGGDGMVVATAVCKHGPGGESVFSEVENIAGVLQICHGKRSYQ